MPTYAIGDVQGCFAALLAMLELIKFNPQTDVLWFAGDLVNRGPQSLEVLRFIRNLGDRHQVVLGNHDLHLLAVAYDAQVLHPGDTLNPILSAPDRDELLDWLRNRPLLHVDSELNYVMAHAGLAPNWGLATAQSLAKEVEASLQGASPALFLQHMYGNQPDAWCEELTGMERLRVIVNYFTRMRFCYADGRLALSYKGDIKNQPPELIPWFKLPERMNADVNILFGHWAALNGATDTPHVDALDTGCVWGNCLTAMRLQDKKRFQIKCPPAQELKSYTDKG